jgi:8-oxo-dGTP diphosphatase
MSQNAVLSFPRPLVTVDLAIFSIQDDALRVLLVQRPTSGGEPFPGQWALPGGFINTSIDSDLEACALRKLREKSGISAPYLEQVGSWGSNDRDPRGWSVTHVYFALIASDDRALKAGGNASEAKWVAVDGQRVRDKLAFDHTVLLRAAITRLRNKVEYTSLPAFLMPVEFTLAELQQVHEILLGRALEKKAFRTRVLATDLLDTVPRKREGISRPAQLYRLRHRRKPLFFTRALGPAQ